MSLQDMVLKEIVEEKVPVTLFLMNGFQFRGFIVDYDENVIVVVTEEKQQIIYKHGISTIAPIRPLKIFHTIS